MAVRAFLLRLLKLVRRRDLLSVVVAFAIVLTARSSLADHYYVPTGSMTPTVAVQDRVLVNKLAYSLRLPIFGHTFSTSSPSRGDVVVLESPEDGITLLKRVVAKPGDRVRVVEGHLELNGTLVPVESRGTHLFERLGARLHPLALDSGGGPDMDLVTVPDDSFLVLGDNRGNSHDGRMFGFVKRQAILGKAVAVFSRDGSLTWIPL
jgi:signal peptidase I